MKEPPLNEAKNKGKRKESHTDWIKKISANKVIEDAQRILKTAVDVLEEEIAAGILAAKHLEKKIIDVDETRNSNPEELMSRVRRDVHDAVDIFLDAFTVLTNHFSSLTETITKPKETTVVKGDVTYIPVIQNDGTAKGGDCIVLQMLFTNEASHQQKVIVLKKDDLRDSHGHKILSRHISINPGSFALAPSAKKEVVIKIKLPLACKPGIYSGIFKDDHDQDLRSLITVTVGK